MLQDENVLTLDVKCFQSQGGYSHSHFIGQSLDPSIRVFKKLHMYDKKTKTKEKKLKASHVILMDSWNWDNQKGKYKAIIYSTYVQYLIVEERLEPP